MIQRPPGALTKRQSCQNFANRSWAKAAAAEIRTLLEVTFITKMRTSIPQDLIDYSNSRKVALVGDQYFSSDIHRS
jgi:hypothetical protein